MVCPRSKADAVSRWAKYRFDDFIETGDEYEKEQYERFKKTTAEHIGQIEDDFCHATACHRMISLCIHAQAFDEAQEWFEQVRDDMVREIIAKEFPQLAEPK